MSDAVLLKLPCPLCSKEHTYPIVVERSVTMGMLTGRKPPPEVSRQFVRSFVCPTTSNRFEATLRLKETAASRITGVTAREAEAERDG